VNVSTTGRRPHCELSGLVRRRFPGNRRAHGSPASPRLSAVRGARYRGRARSPNYPPNGLTLLDDDPKTVAIAGFRFTRAVPASRALPRSKLRAAAIHKRSHRHTLHKEDGTWRRHDVTPCSASRGSPHPRGHTLPARRSALPAGICPDCGGATGNRADPYLGEVFRSQATDSVTLAGIGVDSPWFQGTSVLTEPLRSARLRAESPEGGETSIDSPPRLLGSSESRPGPTSRSGDSCGEIAPTRARRC
jgi:hypothetical protein